MYQSSTSGEPFRDMTTWIHTHKYTHIHSNITSVANFLFLACSSESTFEPPPPAKIKLRLMIEIRPLYARLSELLSCRKLVYTWHVGMVPIFSMSSLLLRRSTRERREYSRTHACGSRPCRFVCVYVCVCVNMYVCMPIYCFISACHERRGQVHWLLGICMHS